MTLLVDSILASSIVLVIMGCVTTFLSVFLHRKLKILTKLSDNLSATVFSRTFNVFDPFPESRKMLYGHIGLLMLLAIYGTYIGFGFLTVKMFELNLVLSFFIFIICLGLLMIDEILDVRKNLKTFIDAIQKGVGMGKGDIDVLFFLKKVSPKLSGYFISLSILFFVMSIVFPFVFNGVLLAFAQFGSVLIVSGSALSLPPHLLVLVVTLTFTTVAMTMQFASGKIKNRIFDLPSLESTNNMANQFYRMRMFVGIQHHHPKLHMPEPEEPKKSEERNLESNED